MINKKLKKFMANKIKKISSKVDYSAARIKILKERIKLLDNKEFDYYKVKKDDFTVIIPKEGENTWMVTTYRFAIMKNLLEFPAGYIEKDESPLKAAKRELKEETGIIAKKFTYLGWVYAVIGISDMKCHIFLAEDLAFGKQELDENEQGTKVKKVKIAAVLKMIKEGKIKNETTVKAFFFYLMKNNFKIV